MASTTTRMREAARWPVRRRPRFDSRSSAHAGRVWVRRTRAGTRPLALEWQGLVCKVRRIHARVVDPRVVPRRETLVLSADDGHVYRVSVSAGGVRWSLEVVTTPPARD